MNDDEYQLAVQGQLLPGYPTFSRVSRDDRPEVGSSTNRMDGSRISSNAMLSRLRCPPLIVGLIQRIAHFSYPGLAETERLQHIAHFPVDLAGIELTET